MFRAWVFEAREGAWNESLYQPNTRAGIFPMWPSSPSKRKVVCFCKYPIDILVVAVGSAPLGGTEGQGYTRVTYSTPVLVAAHGHLLVSPATGFLFWCALLRFEKSLDSSTQDMLFKSVWREVFSPRDCSGTVLAVHNIFGFEAAAWYWHCVDVAWLFLFLTVYW